MARRRKKRLRTPAVVMLFMSVTILCFSVLVLAHRLMNREPEKEKILLVNHDHPLPEDYTVELTYIDDQQVAVSIAEELSAFLEAGRNEGYDLYIRSGYRSREQQEAVMNNRISEFMEEGYSFEEAAEEAGKWVAAPGTSEHETGLAADINSSSEDAYEWLNTHAYEFGFIQRYAENKTEITGIYDEPWHYRYVGREAARIMYENDMCLEEYLEIHG